MERKYFIRGFNEATSFPVLYDKEAYSWREASAKAKEYFKKRGLLRKVMIYEHEEGEQERIAKLIYKNTHGELEEIDVWRIQKELDDKIT